MSTRTVNRKVSPRAKLARRRQRLKVVVFVAVVAVAAVIATAGALASR